MSSNIVPIQKQATAIKTNFTPSNFSELLRFAGIAAKTSFVPKIYQNNPDNILIAVQMGAEIGLAPMQSLQNIAVINGKPSIYGDAMLAVCKASPLCEWVKEEIQGDKKEEWVAVCTVKRTGNPDVVSKFSWQEAKDAQLTGKVGPWTTYPKRMLQMRARGFALRDAFPDLLNGLISQEEAQDYPTQTILPPPVQLRSKSVAELPAIQEMPSIETEKQIDKALNWVNNKKNIFQSCEELAAFNAIIEHQNYISAVERLRDSRPELAQDLQRCEDETRKRLEQTVAPFDPSEVQANV